MLLLTAQSISCNEGPEKPGTDVWAGGVYGHASKSNACCYGCKLADKTLILTMWDLAHQRCNYLICKCNGFGYVKNCAFTRRQIMQATMMNLRCACSLCNVRVPLQWTRCSFVHLVLSLLDDMCVLKIEQSEMVTHLCS